MDKQSETDKFYVLNQEFNSLLEAVQYCLNSQIESFIVKNNLNNIVFKSSDVRDSSLLYTLALVKRSNLYFIKDEDDDSLADSIKKKPQGFLSEQEAITFMEKEFENHRDQFIFYVYHLTPSLNFEQVYIGQVGNL